MESDPWNSVFLVLLPTKHPTLVGRINEQEETPMNAFKSVTLAAALLAGTAFSASAQSSSTVGTGGTTVDGGTSSSTVGTAGSAAGSDCTPGAAGCDAGSASTLATGGTSAGDGTSSSSVGTAGSAAGSGDGSGSASTLGTAGTSAGDGQSGSSVGTAGSAAGAAQDNESNKACPPGQAKKNNGKC